MLLDTRVCNAVCINHVTADFSEGYLCRVVWNHTQGQDAILLVCKAWLSTTAQNGLIHLDRPLNTYNANITSQVCIFKLRIIANNDTYNFWNTSNFIWFLKFSALGSHIFKIFFFNSKGCKFSFYKNLSFITLFRRFQNIGIYKKLLNIIMWATKITRTANIAHHAIRPLFPVLNVFHFGFLTTNTKKV